MNRRKFEWRIFTGRVARRVLSCSIVQREPASPSWRVLVEHVQSITADQVLSVKCHICVGFDLGVLVRSILQVEQQCVTATVTSQREPACAQGRRAGVRWCVQIAHRWIEHPAECVAESDYLKRGAIETTIVTYHMPMTTYFRKRGRHVVGDFPVTDDVALRAMSLPLYEGLTQSLQAEVVTALLNQLEIAGSSV